MVGENARQYLIASVLVAGLATLPMGCREKLEPIPAGSFRAVVEDVVADDLVLVKRMTITAAGVRTVSISEKGGLEEATGNPDPNTGLMTAQVVFVADLIKIQPASGNIFRWMVRIRTGGVTAGGPGFSVAGSAESLRDVLSLNLTSGIYPLSQDISLGLVQGRVLSLKVR